MKKNKVATPATDHAHTPKEAMAPAAHEPSEDDKMRAGEYDLDHLLKAEDIKGDKNKMEYVKKAHGKKLTAMRSIADLKTAAQALAHQKKKDASATKEEPGEAEDKKESKAEEAAEDKGEPASPKVKTKYPKR